MAELSTQMMANYASQELVDGQAELWKAQWSGIVVRHSVTVLRDALWMHMERSHFLPTLADIHECVGLVLERRGARRSESDGQRFLREMHDAREVWERERAEDLAAQAAAEQQTEVFA